MAQGIFKRENWVVVGLLVLITALGAYFRFTGTGWDDYTHFHPDERFMTGEIGIQVGKAYLSFTNGEEAEQQAHCLAEYPDTSGIGGYFDARCSNWNPHNIGKGEFVYGTFPPFAASVFGDLLDQITGSTRYTHYDSFPTVMRSLSAFYDTLVILIAFGIGLELRGKWTGVLAAALYSGAVLPIQIAHFGTADGMANLWMALMLFFSLRIQRTGKWSDYILAGAAFGAALASRFNVAPAVISIMVASGVRMLPAMESSLPRRERWRIFTREFAGLVVAGLFTLLVFRIFNPYAFMGPDFFGLSINPRWIKDLLSARNITSPSNGSPPQWQWVGRVPYLYAFDNMVLWGMGIALGLTGWLVTVWSIVRLVRGKIGAMVTLPLVIWIAVYFALFGGNFVASMRYFLPLYPPMAGLAAYGLIGMVNWAKRNSTRSLIPVRVRRPLAYGLLTLVTVFTLVWAGMFTNIYRHMATFTQAGHWIWENLPGDFSMQVDSAPEGTPLINIALINSIGAQNDILANSTQIHPSYPQSLQFTSLLTGSISSIHAPRIGDYQPDNGSTSLRVWITDPVTQATLVDTVLTDDFDYDGQKVGRSYTIPLDPPLLVESGKTYQFNAQVINGAALVTSGTVMLWEGAWDEPMPPQTCTLPFGVTLAQDPPSGLLSAEDCRKRNTTYSLVTSTQLEIVNEDEESKRFEMIEVLTHSDYFIIGTNRRYDSQSRIPERWPLTNRFYDALFDGELGYELVQEFQETFELGPLRVSDQYLPTYDAPEWLNEFEAEEAFHVYDHPAVFIFKKQADFNVLAMQQILNSVSLIRPYDSSGGANGTIFGPVVWDVQTATASPTALTLPKALADAQKLGGTWSERFHRDSPINTNGVVSVVVWYAVVWLLGIAVWPILYHALAGLSDRGYALSRYFAMVLIGFIAWVASSSAVWPLWNGTGLWGITLTLGAISAIIAYRSRDGMLTFLREKRGLLLSIEALTLGLYVIMLLVRLSNPDIWTTGYGGEKPMDFAYFNGVLRSTAFPPIDPWYAGGYINYYYFGYVVVGVPTLMLGVIPAIAYNLILPTIFAAAGMAAFSAAYTLVDHWRERLDTPERRPRMSRLGNPMVAGIIALMMAVLLGNLDTPRVLLKGLARLGGYDDQITLQRFLEDEYTTANNGLPPNNEQAIEIVQRAADSSFTDSLRYELSIGVDQWRRVFDGVGQWANGAGLPIGAERWFWAPSRVITEAVDGAAITEMPFFTFVYGDLHAHMITMPMTLFVICFVINEVLLAGREKRRWAWRLVAILLAGGLVGLFRAANTWDYPTFLVLGIAGLGFAVWMRWRRVNRAFVLDAALSLSVFVGAGILAARPYTTWYASIYESVKLWEGTKTPLWAYWQIHGLFLFCVVSLMVWETARWLRTVKVRALRGRWLMILGGFVMFVGVILLSIMAAMADYQVALIALPLITWIAVLFFRPDQNPSMRLVLVLTGLALALTFAVEVVVLDGDSGRQNTVFKFYIHVWMLFSVAGGAAIAWLLQAAEQWRARLAIPWYAVGGVLFFSAMLFPITATLGKANFRLSPEVGATLDGDAFMAATTDYYENYGKPIDMSLDYAAIQWLQDNVQGTPTIMEGRTRLEEYFWGSRISIHTGLPGLVGWNFHQRQQRTLPGLGALVWQRVANVNQFYTTTDTLEAWRILMAYDVEYIVVASLERVNYGDSGGLNKFEAMVADGWLERAEVVDGTPIIYRVVKENGPSIYVASLP